MNKGKASHQVTTLLGLKVKSKRLPNWLANCIQSSLNCILGFTLINKYYARLPVHEDIKLSETILDELNISLDLSGEPINSYASTGPQIFVANHPHGLIDGIILDHLITSLRPEVQFMTTHTLAIFPEYADRLILVDPLKKGKRHALNIQGWIKATRLVSDGGALVVFPAGRVAKYHWRNNKVLDPVWNSHIATLARRTGATVVPIFIHGRNSLSFQILGLISRSLQNLLIFKELPKMRNANLRIAFGKPLAPDTWSDIADDKQLINHFRDKVEILGKS